MAISDLQLSIIALGAAGVAGVFAYNKWLERRYRRQSERAFRSDHADVLVESKPPLLAGDAARVDERIEPVDGAPPPPAAPAAAALAVEPLRADPGPVPEPAAPLLHAAADCSLRFEAAEPIPAPQLWQASNEIMASIEKPLRWLGWNENRRVWQEIKGHTGMSCRQWRIALQLADRRGALSAREIEAFVRGVQQVADRFLAVTELPDRNELALRAQELDKFCAGVDVQIGIHIVANDAAGFAGTKLRGIAEATGMRLEEDGVFRARDDSGHPLYAMSNLEAALFAPDELSTLVTHGLTLNLDVPCVMSGGAVFGSMVTAARQLAAGLNGTVVDDNRAPLVQKSLDVIRAKIVEFQDLMSRRGIAAGSATALRLFS